MNILQKLFSDRIYPTGIILIVFSAFIFSCASFTSNEPVLFATFCVNYLASLAFWGYLIILFCTKKWRKTVKTSHLFPALILSLISAYALNRLMCVFEQSVGWFSVLLVIIAVTLLSLRFFYKMNKILKITVLFLTGIGFSVFLYLSFYLLPIYIISIPMAFGLGVSLHTFVPLVFCISIIIWMYRYRNTIRKTIFAFAAGLVVATSIAIGYSVKWNQTIHQINAAYHNIFAEDNAILPAWIRVAQRIEKNAITNKILKINLVYKEFDTDNWFWGFDNFSGNNYTEQKLHDPLVVIAALFSEPLALNTNEKINILRSIYDSRHQATERLWDGDDLHTTFVNSFVQLYPEYRLAYSENVVSVRNRSPHHWNRQEAVYTFHLPQGSVATSLSLWINGIEEKAILTSKEKAENAYKTIVGREMRDPSLVLWQEGNTLIVRVFPVEYNSERTFKIGITSPLKFRDNKLIYEPVYFDGTDCSDAKMQVSVNMKNEMLDCTVPKFLKATAKGWATGKSMDYSPSWTISMNVPEISQHVFRFKTNTEDYFYSVSDSRKKTFNSTISSVYLDLNASWTKEDFAAVWNIVKDKKVKYFDGTQMESINKNNKDLVFAEMQQLQFSLFPFYRIPKPGESLVIGKSGEISPNVADLEGSSFLKNTKQGISQAILFFNFGENLSPYLKTIREFRLLHYLSGNFNDLQKSIENGFELAVEDANCIFIDDANLQITRHIPDKIDRNTNETADAPDHLMRLFTYNHVLAQYAQSWNSENPVFTDEMVHEAAMAYIVSPVSSLVVLESIADYERFDITDTENSLKNASKSQENSENTPVGNGILILLLFSIGFVFRQYLKKSIK